MKAYIVTTGVVFGLIVLLHIWRAVAEGPQLAREPFFILVTAIAAGLCVWAWRLVWRWPRA